MKFDFQETQRLMQEPVPGISAVPDDQNARYFHVVVAGKLHLSFEVSAIYMIGLKKRKFPQFHIVPPITLIKVFPKIY